MEIDWVCYAGVTEMDKPLLYAYDGKDVQDYSPLLDIFDVIVRPILPSLLTLEDYAALVLHTSIMDLNKRREIFLKCKERNLPVFVVTCNEKAMDHFRGSIRDEGLDYDNVHWVNTYQAMYEKIRLLFVQ